MDERVPAKDKAAGSNPVGVVNPVDQIDEHVCHPDACEGQGCCSDPGIVDQWEKSNELDRCRIPYKLGNGSTVMLMGDDPCENQKNNQTL